jgi:hypothetical protein
MGVAPPAGPTTACATERAVPTISLQFNVSRRRVVGSSPTGGATEPRLTGEDRTDGFCIPVQIGRFTRSGLKHGLWRRSGSGAARPPHRALDRGRAGDTGDFAEMVGTEVLVIDDDTTTRSFKRQLRWSAAYHRLAEGL